MKIYRYETVTETKEKEVGYTAICNMCGKENVVNGEPSWNDDTQNISLHFGYESRFDTQTWSFDVCDDCLENIVKQFKYVPDGFKQDDYSLLDNDEHQKVFDNWKETGEWEGLKFKTYEELATMNNGWFSMEWINDAIKKYHPDRPELEPPMEE